MKHGIRGALLGWIWASVAAAGVCPSEPVLENHTGGGAVACPCFEMGEQAGAVFDLPADEYPIEILKIGVGWGSAAGSQPDSLEQAIHVYPAGLPNPGTPLFSLNGPVLTDGAINVFDVELEPGEVIVSSGPFTVALEFANDNAGSAFTPTTVHDGQGCIFGRNVIFASPGGWLDVCGVGLSGNWVFTVEYRKVECGVSSGPGSVLIAGLDLVAGGMLDLSWTPSCSASDDNYSVYEGTLGSFYDHLPKVCDTGGATGAVVSPALGDRYYLVVPRDASNEGSYGTDGFGAERPPAIATCRPPDPVACP